jgi:hypothetical protein
MYPKYGDTAMREDEDEETGETEDEETSDEPADDLRRAIIDAHKEAPVRSTNSANGGGL